LAIANCDGQKILVSVKNRVLAKKTLQQVLTEIDGGPLVMIDPLVAVVAHETTTRSNANRVG
jgi:hypothetical protein